MPIDPALNRRLLIGGGAGLCLAGEMGSVARAQAPPIKVNIICTSSVPQLTLTELMMRQGYLKQMGVDASITHLADGSRLVASLMSGEMDICIISGLGQIYPAVERGGKMKILAGGNTVVAQAVYTTKPDIKRLKDLEGRTVGCGALGSLLHSTMVAALTKQGVDYTKVNFVNIGSNSDVFKAVAVGKVDAGPSTADIYYDQAKYGVHSIAEMWKVIPEYPYQGAYATDATIARKREGLVRVLAAYAKLYRFMMSPQSKQPWIDAYLAAAGHDPKHAENLWRFNIESQSYSVNLTIPDSSLEYLQNLNLKLKVQQKRIAMDQLRDMSLAQEALRRIGPYTPAKPSLS